MSGSPLEPGDVIGLAGRDWLIEEVEDSRDHDEIEEWDYRDGRIFASVGTPDDEADPDKGHGWLCRLVDAGVLTVAGFRRVRKPELE